jgi:hypothetical protein
MNPFLELENTLLHLAIMVGTLPPPFLEPVLPYTSTRSWGHAEVAVALIMGTEGGTATVLLQL